MRLDPLRFDRLLHEALVRRSGARVVALVWIKCFRASYGELDTRNRRAEARPTTGAG